MDFCPTAKALGPPPSKAQGFRVSIKLYYIFCLTAIHNLLKNKTILGTWHMIISALFWSRVPRFNVWMRQVNRPGEAWMRTAL